MLPEEVLPEAPPIARSRYNPAYFRCPRSAKFKRTCKCGDAACGKGLCQHGLAKTVCKREQCIVKAGGVCKHLEVKSRCDECSSSRSRCRHGNVKQRSCVQCRREQAEEKAAALSEKPATPEVRVSTGRKVFPGPGMPLWAWRGSPELT